MALATRRKGVRGLFRRSVSGSTQEELLARLPNALPTDWSRDGTSIVYQQQGENTSFDVWILPVSAGRPPIAFLNTPVSERRARLAPNGDWIAYSSAETGQEEVWVRSFAKPGGKWQISTEGGVNPVWSRNGKELFFLDRRLPNPALMGVSIKPGPEFRSDPPTVVFRTASFPGTDSFDVTSDGRFLMTQPVEPSASAATTIVVNWAAALSQ